MKNILTETVPMPKALTIILLQGVANYAILRWQGNQLRHVIEDQEQRITILLESTNFLLDKADDATAIELNEKLDYWRVIRGIDARS